MILMILKKMAPLLFIVTIGIAMISCGSKMPFDPRAYNQADDPNLGGGIGEGEGEGEDGDFDTGPIIPEKDDPFKQPPYNNPDQHFPASKFDSWEIRATFSPNNTPTYNFTGGGWNRGNAEKNEYAKGGPNTSGGGQTISKVTYYLYKSKNPVFASTSSYNNGAHGERMERFYFYRFTGSGGNIVWLDNYLIVVDTYTKLVFAFAMPTAYREIMGNKVPTAWGSVDTRIKNGKYKFYEYDPVGIVRENGSIELYGWYTSAMGKGNYDPIITEGGYDREVATYGKPGRSPYYAKGSGSDVSTGDTFRDMAKNKIYSKRRETRGQSDILDIFEFSADAKKLIQIEEIWKNGKTKTLNYEYIETIDKNKARYKRSSGNLVMIVEIHDNEKELYIPGPWFGDYRGRTDFADTGPWFTDRVKGRTYRDGAGNVYSFVSEGEGSRIPNYNGKSYKWYNRDERIFATYGYKSLFWFHYMLKIEDYVKSDGTTVKDGVIHWTTTSLSNPGDWDTTIAIYGWRAVVISE